MFVNLSVHKSMKTAGLNSLQWKRMGPKAFFKRKEIRPMRAWLPLQCELNHTGTNTAGLMPKKLPSLPAIVALIFRLPAKIANRLL